MHKPNIICVDDEIIILNNLREQLRRKFGNGYNIEIAESGQEALELISELLSDKKDVPLVISDYIMPNMLGDELLKRIYELKPETVSVLLTGQAVLGGVINSVNDAGIYKFITKPWVEEELFANVQDALDHYYLNRVRDRKNKDLELKNRQLNEKIRVNRDELLKRQNQLDMIEQLNSTARISEEIFGQINSSFYALKAANDTIITYQEELTNKNPDMLMEYLKSMDSFYKFTSEAIKEVLNIFRNNGLDNLWEYKNRLKIDELIKKIDKKRGMIFESTDNLMASASENPAHVGKSLTKVAAWENEEILLFNVQEIIYFQAEKGVNYVVTKKGKYRTKETLDLLEFKLKKNNFFRCHRSFLINLKYINKIIPQIDYNYVSRLEGIPHEIPISKNRIVQLKKLLGI